MNLLYKNIHDDKVYKVISFAINSLDLEPYAVYLDTTDKTVYVTPTSEFISNFTPFAKTPDE